VVSIKEV